LGSLKILSQSSIRVPDSLQILIQDWDTRWAEALASVQSQVTSPDGALAAPSEDDGLTLAAKDEGIKAKVEVKSLKP
jgi:hypothetical protein